MGQKVNPNGLRIGIIKDWNSKWYADKKDIAKFIKEDEVVRTFIKKKYYQSAISSIKIERSEGKIVIFIYTGRPGTLIGKQGAGIEQMKAEVQKLVGDKFVVINIMEVKNPDMDAQLVAENIAAQLEKRIAFRSALRKAESDGRGRQRDQNLRFRSSRRSGNSQKRALSRGQYTPAHFESRHRLRFCGSAHDLRDYRRQGVGLQGRNSGQAREEGRRKQKC